MGGDLNTHLREQWRKLAQRRVLYHVTPSYNLTSILGEGLRPGSLEDWGGGGSGVWLAPDAQMARRWAEERATLLRDENRTPSIALLEVDVTGLGVEHGFSEVVYDRPIEPERIRWLTTETHWDWEETWFPTEVFTKTAMPQSWRPVTERWWPRGHDVVVMTDVRRRRRHYEVYVLGQYIGGRDRLDDAKALAEDYAGFALDWVQEAAPPVEVVHYFFGPTTEFTEPVTYYRAAIPQFIVSSLSGGG